MDVNLSNWPVLHKVLQFPKTIQGRQMLLYEPAKRSIFRLPSPLSKKSHDFSPLPICPAHQRQEGGVSRER